MTDLLLGGSAWWALPAGLLVFGVTFGFFPGAMLRLIVLLYPKGDERRRELINELYVLGRVERIEWVFQQLETALFEGLHLRRAQKRDRRRRRHVQDQLPVLRADLPAQYEQPLFQRGLSPGRVDDVLSALLAQQNTPVWRLSRHEIVRQGIIWTSSENDGLRQPDIDIVWWRRIVDENGSQ